MIWHFTEEQMESGLHVVELEEDEVLFYAETISGEGKNYTLTGKAIIEGETYHDFQIEFALLDMPKEETAEEVMNMDWDWYDFPF